MIRTLRAVCREHDELEEVISRLCSSRLIPRAGGIGRSIDPRIGFNEASESRSATTAIYYLLEQQQLSRWHVVDADEIWHFYGGAPLELLAYDPGSRQLERQVLHATPDGSRPVGIIPVRCLAGGAQPG